MDRATAQRISALMLDYGAKLDESVDFVKTRCSDEEFNRYKEAVGRILGNMLLDIMNPLYEEHPDLRPPNLN
jgi:hypothetical protein